MPAFIITAKSDRCGRKIKKGQDIPDSDQLREYLHGCHSRRIGGATRQMGEGSFAYRLLDSKENVIKIMRLWRNLHFLHHMQVFCTKSYEKGHPDPHV